MGDPVGDPGRRGFTGAAMLPAKKPAKKAGNKRFEPGAAMVRMRVYRCL
jgi:hypothetical protein